MNLKVSLTTVLFVLSLCSYTHSMNYLEKQLDTIVKEIIDIKKSIVHGQRAIENHNILIQHLSNEIPILEEKLEKNQNFLKEKIVKRERIIGTHIPAEQLKQLQQKKIKIPRFIKQLLIVTNNQITETKIKIKDIITAIETNKILITTTLPTEVRLFTKEIERNKKLLRKKINKKTKIINKIETIKRELEEKDVKGWEII